jgi:hypothetical protein
MSKQQLLAYPYVEELSYRNKIDTYKMNLMLRSIEESVLRCILRGSESAETLSDLKLGVETSYNAIQSKTSSIIGYAMIPAGTLFATSFDEVTGGRRDVVGGITTLEWVTNRRFTKIPRYDIDNDGIADQVAPSVTILVDGTPRSIDNKAYNALNRNNKSFWIESATGEHDIEIQLPPTLNKNFNYIELIPFPMFGMEILSVTYQDVYSVDTVIFDSTDKQYAFYDNSGPLIMHLSPKETNGTFKIKVNVTHGALGFSSIDIGMIDYNDQLQTVYMKFANVPSRTATTIYTLNDLSLDFYVNEAIVFDNYIQEVAITNGTDSGADKVAVTGSLSHNTYSFNGQTITLSTSQDMYLKIVIKEHNTTTPVIRGVKLTYEV